jgi:hypothetical protein
MIIKYTNKENRDIEEVEIISATPCIKDGIGMMSCITKKVKELDIEISKVLIILE